MPLKLSVRLSNQQICMETMKWNATNPFNEDVHNAMSMQKDYPLSDVITFGNQNGHVSVHDQPIAAEDVPPNIVEDGFLSVVEHGVSEVIDAICSDM